MFQAVLKQKNFFAFIFASITFLVLFKSLPFQEGNPFLIMIKDHNKDVFLFIKYTYFFFLFSIPYLVYVMLLSLLFIFVFRPDEATAKIKLPKYITPEKRDKLFLIVGEVHNPRKPVPVSNPEWLTIPEKGLYTGIAIFGAIGSGKTSTCMYPFAEQIFGTFADDPERKIGGLILEVKGDFCYKVREILKKYNREDDYVEISLDGDVVYNPLNNDLDPYALAYQIASLLNNLFGKGKEPFWQQAYTNLVKFIILLHKLLFDYCTFLDIYQCAIDPVKLDNLIRQGEKMFSPVEYIAIETEEWEKQVASGEKEIKELLSEFVFVEEHNAFTKIKNKDLEKRLQEAGIEFDYIVQTPADIDEDKQDLFESIKRWFYKDWLAIDQRLRTSIVEGISVFLSLFDTDIKVKKVFCPPKEAFDEEANFDYKFGKPLISFREAIEQGKVVALNFPVSVNPGLAKAIGTMLKLDYQRAVLSRIPDMETQKDKYFRPTAFICDEYQNFATTGENDPNGDEKFFSLSRQPKCIPIVATQSISSLKTTLPGETWRTLLQTFRTKIFLTLSDDFSQKIASEFCGKEDKKKVNINISESSQNAKVSWFSSNAYSDKSTVSTSKSINVQRDFVFDVNVFAQLKNAQSIIIPYDGINSLPPCYCYLKPYYLDPNISYFEQIEKGML